MNQPNSKRKTREEIIDLAVPLFAKRGYDGVSMRDVAAAIGLTPAALYYHFPDKEHLYFDAVEHDFKGKSGVLITALNSPEPAWARLETFIAELAHLVATDKNFLRLMQWVLLDSDEARQHKLLVHVFRDLFGAVHDLAAELDARHDAHMLAMTIIGLVFFPFIAGATRKFMPGHRPEQDKPAVLARHVIELLRTSLSDTTCRPDRELNTMIKGN